MKKQGEIILKGHKSYELVLNLQLGIRYSIGKSESAQMRELRAGDFDPREKYWTRFPPEGSKIMPLHHQTTEFRWKDYCPTVFRHLRKLFSVDPTDYMMAICGNDALRELSSPGKSGSFFYLTQDDRFMIKTVKKSEFKVLIRMLPSYYKHVTRYENSLLTKFFGVHGVKLIGGRKVRFIIMGNLFCSEHRIHRRFDLKGSSYGRTTDKAEAEIDETTTLKDLDLNFVFRLQKSWFLALLRKPLLRLGANMPAWAEHVSRNSNFKANREIYEIYSMVLYSRIIDILQVYDISKKLEHVYKSLQADPTSISAVDPKSYLKRFQDFIRKIFIEDND